MTYPACIVPANQNKWLEHKIKDFGALYTKPKGQICLFVGFYFLLFLGMISQPLSFRLHFQAGPCIRLMYEGWSSAQISFCVPLKATPLLKF